MLLSLLKTRWNTVKTHTLFLKLCQDLFDAYIPSRKSTQSIYTLLERLFLKNVFLKNIFFHNSIYNKIPNSLTLWCHSFMCVPNVTAIIPAPFPFPPLSWLLILHWNNLLCFSLCSCLNLGNDSGVITNPEWISLLITHKRHDSNLSG